MDPARTIPATMDPQILTLQTFVATIEMDCDERRLADRILARYGDARKHLLAVFLDDDLERFKNERESHFDDDSLFLCISDCCLVACLLGAKTIAEYIFKQYPACNPKNWKYVLSFAIVCGNTKWVQQIVEDYDVDINDHMYCFYLFAELTNNAELSRYKKDEPTTK